MYVTITGKESVSERVMNTILNGMMRERRGRLQFQHKYQKLRKIVTSAENGGGTTGITTTSLVHKKLDLSLKHPIKIRRIIKIREEDLLKRMEIKMKVVEMMRRIKIPHLKG